MTFGGKIMASAGSCFLLFSCFVLSFCSGVLQTEAQKQSGLGNTRRPQQRVYIFTFMYMFQGSAPIPVVSSPKENPLPPGVLSQVLALPRRADTATLWQAATPRRADIATLRQAVTPRRADTATLRRAATPGRAATATLRRAATPRRAATATLRQTAQ